MVTETGRVCADLMSGGRLFQSRLPAAVKARSPTVTSLVVGMMTSSDDDDQCLYELLLVKKNNNKYSPTEWT